MDYERLGKFLKKKEKKGWTQDEIAKMVGLSRQTISKIENGVMARVSLIHMEALLRLIGYDMCIIPHNPFSKEEPDYFYVNEYLGNKEELLAKLGL